MPIDPKTAKRFEDWGVPLPTSTHHGFEADIEASRHPLEPTHWRQEGNKLIGTIDNVGEFVNFLPTDVILTGTDENGLPVFRKVIL